VPGIRRIGWLQMTLFTRAYAPVYRRVVFPLYEGLLRQRGMYRRYRDLSTAPTLDIEQLRESQRRKLNRSTGSASRVMASIRGAFTTSMR
jgi:hypothetical protein